MSRMLSCLSAVGVLLLATAGTGCVSLARFEAMEAERDIFRRQVEGLTRTGESSDEQLAARAAALDAQARELAERKSRIAELERARGALETKLHAEIAAGRIRLSQVRDGLSVELSEEILFDSGSAVLEAKGEEVLRAIAGELEASGYPISVMGHTDDVPIGLRLREKYASNWELGAARASRVTRLMIEAGIGSDRLAAISYAEFRPAVPNTDDASRAQNRRIEIRLQPFTGDSGAS